MHNSSIKSLSQILAVAPNRHGKLLVEVYFKTALLKGQEQIVFIGCINYSPSNTFFGLRIDGKR